MRGEVKFGCATAESRELILLVRVSLWQLYVQVEKVEFATKRSLIKIHGAGKIIGIENCRNELHDVRDERSLPNAMEFTCGAPL